MYKIVHIHNDSKFIDGSSIFECDMFNNIIVIFSLNREYNGIYKDTALYFNNNLKGTREVIDLCNSAEMVVVWGLDNVKSYIVNRLNKNVKVAWRFFGYELYSKNPDKYLSSATKVIISKDNFNRYLELIKNIIIHIKPFRNIVKKYRNPYLSEFESALQRANIFIGLCKNEYDSFVDDGIKLPMFLSTAFKSHDQYPFKINLKNNTIIIGHSRSIYNNHFDIIEIINSSTESNNYEFIIPFNYGTTNEKYNKILEVKSRNIRNIEVIRNFLPFSEYQNLIRDKVIACVFNNYRQMAGGNIFLAFHNGVKVYINKISSLFEFLVIEGFTVFTIEDFEKDLVNNNLKLDDNEAIHNINQYFKLTQKYSEKEFQKSINNFLQGDYK